MWISFIILVMALDVAEAQTTVRCCADDKIQDTVEEVVKLAELAVDKPTRFTGRLWAMERRLRMYSSLPDTDREAFARLKAIATEYKNQPPDVALHALTLMSREAHYLALRYEGGTLILADAWCEDEQMWLQRDLSEVHSPWPGCGQWGPNTALQQKAPLPDPTPPR